MDRSLTTTKPVARASVPAAEGAQARRYQRSARSENTLRAYRASLARFASWCDARSLKPVPATPETVAAFLASEADSAALAAAWTASLVADEAAPAASEAASDAAAAADAGVNTKLVYRAIKLGELRHTRIGAGRNIRVHRDWATQWMKRAATGGDR